MQVDISVGELVDKITILSIKLANIKNKDKLVNIRKEYDLLKTAMERIGITVDSDEFKELRAINMQLWNIEDEIRIKEEQKAFDEEFIELARSVYFTNDRRAAVKRKINIAYGSDLIEEKEYVEYQN